MDTADHIAQLRSDGERLADVAERAGLDASVPPCPGWSVRDLVGHLAGVHRWARLFVAGRGHPTDDAEDAELFAVPADDALVTQFRDGHRALVDALEAAPDDLRSWTFLPGLPPRAFWARRQAHETAVHRVDIESAAGLRSPVPAAVAADGVDELLGLLARPGGRLVADPPMSLAVRTSDVPGTWTVEIGPAGRTVHHEERPAGCSVAGPADAVYRLLWNRVDDVVRDAVDVTGDRAVLDLWRTRATIRWG